MASDKFRRQLRQEAERWWNEGIIDAQLYDTLSDRYQFQAIETQASSRFTTILIGLGGILVGIGAITFVAANWTVWTREVKLALLLSVFVGTNLAGFLMWRSPKPGGTQKLGASLLLLGGLMLGANLSLVSQMFHQSGDLYELLLVWGLGVWLMAFSLPVTSLSWLSLLLVGAGYFPAVFDAESARQLTVFHLSALHMPVVVLLLFVPLAYRTRSRLTFGLAALLFGAAWVSNVLSLNLWAVELAIVVPPALLWAYGVQPRQRWIASKFQAVARGMAAIALAVSFYILSFNQWVFISLEDASGFDVAWGKHVAADLLVGCALTMWLWLRLYRVPEQFNPFQSRSLHTGTVALMLLAAGGIVAVHLHATPIPIWVALVYNVLLFFLAIAAIRDGLAFGSRRTFWGGMVVLIVGLFTRTLEYDTDLLVKAIVFVGCGVGTIAAGLWFERNIQQDKRNAPALLEPLPED